VVSSLQASQPKFCMHLSPPRCAPHPKHPSKSEALFNISWHSFLLRWGVFSPPVQPQNWRTTPCRLSATAYSIYSQLPFISGLCHKIQARFREHLSQNVICQYICLCLWIGHALSKWFFNIFASLYILERLYVLTPQIQLFGFATSKNPVRFVQPILLSTECSI
jgi:hypothetical protein